MNHVVEVKRQRSIAVCEVHIVNLYQELQALYQQLHLLHMYSCELDFTRKYRVNSLSTLSLLIVRLSEFCLIS